MSELLFPDTAPPATTRTIERRASVRLPRSFGASFQKVPEGADEHWRARVRDISTSGIGLLTEQHFQPGTTLCVELLSEDESLAYSLLARVVHAGPHTEGEWLLGCTFARHLTSDELQQLL